MTQHSPCPVRSPEALVSANAIHVAKDMNLSNGVMAGQRMWSGGRTARVSSRLPWAHRPWPLLCSPGGAAGQPAILGSHSVDECVCGTQIFLLPHQTGDQIVEVNGIDFSNLDHKEVRWGTPDLCPMSLTTIPRVGSGLPVAQPQRPISHCCRP